MANVIQGVKKRYIHEVHLLLRIQDRNFTSNYYIPLKSDYF